MSENNKNLRREKRKRNLLNYTSSTDFKTFIRRCLVHRLHNASISETALKIVDSIIMNLFTELATEASNLMAANIKRTLSAWEFQLAVVQVLKGEVARHALCEGERKMTAYVFVNSRAKLRRLAENNADNANASDNDTV